LILDLKLKTMDIRDYVQNRTPITKGWVQKTLLRSPVSISAIAEAMGMSDSYLYKMANSNEDKHLRLQDLPILIHETGDITILQELASMFGLALVPVNGNPEGLVKVLQEMLAALERIKG